MAGRKTHPQAREIRAYRQHVAGAKRRGIEWAFASFEEWFDVWQRSGKWEQRGKSAGQYVMARFGDVGPYSPANVYICTMAQNVSDAAINHGGTFGRGKLGTGRGWHRRDDCPSRPYQVVFHRKSIGTFATQAEAEAIYASLVREFNERIAAGAFDRRLSVHASSLFCTPEISHANACESIEQIRRPSER